MMEFKDIRAVVAAAKCDGLIIAHPYHFTWATGLVSSHALLYISGERGIVATDSRYAEAARKLPLRVVIAGRGESLTHALASQLADGGQDGASGGGRRIGYQPEYTSVDEFEQMKCDLAGYELAALPGVLRKPIAHKHAVELAAIERAGQITDAVFKEVLPLLTPGVSEQAIAAELVYRQLQHGADGISPEFWPVVAFGARSALPHAQPGASKLARGDVVLLDFGCTVGGYCSDMTRVVACGAPSDELRKVYEVVLRAQQAALGMIAAGVDASAVDGAARDIITAAGYGERFGHSLGHGVGLETHEWPTLGPRSHYPLPAKCVVAVEPAVYLPGKFGVRIEDMVYVGRDEVRNLTTSPKELIVL